VARSGIGTAARCSENSTRPRTVKRFAPGRSSRRLGGQDFIRIFHAGFHDPDDWSNLSDDSVGAANLLSESGGSHGADYFAAIGSCIAQVLDAAVAQKLSSVAFPLIGCGLFGLDEKMLVLQFLDALEEVDDRLAEGERLHVWLVIRDRAQFESAAGVFLDLLLQERSKMAMVRLKPSGVPILDRFAARLSQRTNEEWAKWLLCRYAEIAVELICYGLCRAHGRPPHPNLCLRRVARRLSGSVVMWRSVWPR
jgi:Macro domain